MRLAALSPALAIAAFQIACASAPLVMPGAVSPARREDAIRRAQVWTTVNVASMDLVAGPPEGAFAPDALVSCQYIDRALTGKSPKFICAVGDHDEVKVKYGRTNGEVYAEVAATRLLWALGFGADHMYPVRVECHGCPANFRGPPQRDRPPIVVTPAAIERRMAGRAIETHEESGWGWGELDLIDERAGGAPRAHVDALRLLAAFIQHTDSKPAQQRLLCLTPGDPQNVETCSRPFMMLNDVGQTFGRANRFNRDVPGSVNFEEWSRTPVWSDPTRCVANISKSATGTLDHPVIREAGRQFLADLLGQLSDAQLHDLFEVAHFELRSGHRPDEWVDAFKRKRSEIVSHTCPM
jgi:hypothetical protein